MHYMEESPEMRCYEFFSKLIAHNFNIILHYGE